MAMWVRQLPDAVPFTVIHDSYGVPSPYVSSIRRTITQTFVELYESFDIIEAIQQDYLRLTGEELPPPPTRGSLDLKATLNWTMPHKENPNGSKCNTYDTYRNLKYLYLHKPDEKYDPKYQVTLVFDGNNKAHKAYMDNLDEANTEAGQELLKEIAG